MFSKQLSSQNNISKTNSNWMVLTFGGILCLYFLCCILYSNLMFNCYFRVVNYQDTHMCTKMRRGNMTVTCLTLYDQVGPRNASVNGWPPCATHLDQSSTVKKYLPIYNMDVLLVAQQRLMLFPCIIVIVDSTLSIDDTHSPLFPFFFTDCYLFVIHYLYPDLSLTIIPLLLICFSFNPCILNTNAMVSNS